MGWVSRGVRVPRGVDMMTSQIEWGQYWGGVGRNESQGKSARKWGLGSLNETSGEHILNIP